LYFFIKLYAPSTKHIDKEMPEFRLATRSAGFNPHGFARIYCGGPPVAEGMFAMYSRKAPM
jgi:hypothetical protein